LIAPDSFNRHALGIRPGAPEAVRCRAKSKLEIQLQGTEGKHLDIIDSVDCANAAGATELIRADYLHKGCVGATEPEGVRRRQ
jgi:hypothetical protein